MSASPFFKLGALWKAKLLLAHPSKIGKVFRDERTPLFAKILPLLAAGYVLFPLDIAPDFIPLLGQIDDVTIVFGLISYALSMIPDKVFEDAGFESRHIQTMKRGL